MATGLGAVAELPERSSVVPDDEGVQLVRQARAGDRGAWDRLYGLHASTVHGVLVARAPLAEVDDLLQDVFLQAYRQLSSLRDDAAFGSWLLAICRNRATDIHRRRGAGPGRSPVRLAAEPAVPGPQPSSEATEVLAIIQGLPEAYRETLALRLVEGMTGPEIAARTGLTPGSVRVNLHRGMKQLRERLQARSSDRE